MFEYISGRVVKILSSSVIVDCNGIGYRIIVSSNTSVQLEIESRATLLIHFVVKEDSQTLYGFSRENERAMFETLILTNGVGPKLAMDILSKFNVSQVKDCILNENIEMLIKTPGLGVKKAKKIIIEAKDRVREIESEEISYINEEIVDVMLSLGYTKREIESKIGSYNSVEDGVKDLLTKLSR